MMILEGLLFQEIFLVCEKIHYFLDQLTIYSPYSLLQGA